MRDRVKATIHTLVSLYRAAYGALCGRHPRLRPWHFQWHALKDLNRDLGELLPALRGRVLDMGCGLQPYRRLFAAADTYTGCDIAALPGVDVVIRPGEKLPFADGAFDVVFSTQVFEHVANLPETIAELRRVLAQDGTLLVSVPFIFQVHGAPHDYRRLSEFGIRQALEGFEVAEVRRGGAIGSALAVLLLGWLDNQLEASVPLWGLKMLLLPVWLPFCLLVNVGALLMDAMDTTNSFYHNLLVVARKQGQPPADENRPARPE